MDKCEGGGGKVEKEKKEELKEEEKRKFPQIVGEVNVTTTKIKLSVNTNKIDFARNL